MPWKFGPIVNRQRSLSCRELSLPVRLEFLVVSNFSSSSLSSSSSSIFFSSSFIFFSSLFIFPDFSTGSAVAFLVFFFAADLGSSVLSSLLGNCRLKLSKKCFPLFHYFFSGMRIRHFFPRIRIRMRLSWKKIPDPT